MKINTIVKYVVMLNIMEKRKVKRTYNTIIKAIKNSLQ